MIKVGLAVADKQQADFQSLDAAAAHCRLPRQIGLPPPHAGIRASVPPPRKDSRQDPKAFRP